MMMRNQLSFAIIDEEDLDVKVFVNGSAVGHAWGTRSGNRLKLEDIEVHESFRHRRIGTNLLRFVLQAAGAAGITEVCGIVTAKDVKQTPGLIAWYEREGFTASEPDLDTDPRLQAVKKIVRPIHDRMHKVRPKAG